MRICNSARLLVSTAVSSYAVAHTADRSKKALQDGEQVDETCHSKYVAYVIVHAFDEYLAAFGLCVLQSAEKQTQTAGRDVLQCGTVEDDVVAVAVVKHLHIFPLGEKRRYRDALRKP